MRYAKEAAYDVAASEVGGSVLVVVRMLHAETLAAGLRRVHGQELAGIAERAVANQDKVGHSVDQIETRVDLELARSGRLEADGDAGEGVEHAQGVRGVPVSQDQEAAGGGGDGVAVAEEGQVLAEDAARGGVDEEANGRGSLGRRRRGRQRNRGRGSTDRGILAREDGPLLGPEADVRLRASPRVVGDATP